MELRSGAKLDECEVTRCSHVLELLDVTANDVLRKKADVCSACRYSGPSRWLCLQPNCLNVFCGAKGEDHSTAHYKETSHPLQLNLKARRVWCNKCDVEVSLTCNVPGWKLGEALQTPRIQHALQTTNPKFSPSDVSVADEEAKHEPPVHEEARPAVHEVPKAGRMLNERVKPTVVSSDVADAQDVAFTKTFARTNDEDVDNPRGLTGLANIGNTCYANAALQALSNCVPLREYMVAENGACARALDALASAGEQQPHRPSLAIAYSRLIHELWSPRRAGYVVPSGVLQAVRFVNPSFRGYAQQDSQEFLRCFMDQLHEELKEPLYHWEVSELELQLIQSRGHYSPPPPGSARGTARTRSSSASSSSASSSSMSSDSSEYETAGDDSGMSSIDSSRGSAAKEAKGRKRRRRYATLGSADTVQAERRRERQRTASLSLSSPSLELPSGISGIRNEQLRESEYVKKRRPVKYRSIVTDVFDGKILSSVQCLSCRLVSRTVETFQDLSLPIPSADQMGALQANVAAAEYADASASLSSPSSWTSGYLSSLFSYVSWPWLKSWFVSSVVRLEDCLAALFSTDELKEDNMYSCDRCKKLRNGVKFCKLLELPEVLCIHLKRFKHEFAFSTKISTFVSFPLEELDMTPFVHQDCTNQIRTYDLVGVICHHGGAGGGHYTSYALNSVDHRWYEFDDTSVTQVDMTTVENAEAYVLFYRKSTLKAEQRRLGVEKLLNAAEKSAALLNSFSISQEWIRKFNTFAEPGPVTNFDFLCPHGLIAPEKAGHLHDLYAHIPSSAWKLLHDEFGGGPVCNHLAYCYECQRELQRRTARRTAEHEALQRALRDAQRQTRAEHTYALSIAWLDEWESFVFGRQYDPPGPVDNTDVVVIRNDQYVMRPNNYVQIPRDVWEYFYTTYGGGPEILYSPAAPHAPVVNLKPQVVAVATASRRAAALAAAQPGALAAPSSSPTMRRRRTPRATLDTPQMPAASVSVEVQQDMRGSFSSNGEASVSTSPMVTRRRARSANL